MLSIMSYPDASGCSSDWSPAMDRQLMMGDAAELTRRWRGPPNYNMMEKVDNYGGLYVVYDKGCVKDALHWCVLVVVVLID